MTKAELFEKIATDAAQIANKDRRLPVGIQGDIFRPAITSSHLALDYSQGDIAFAVMAVKGKDMRGHRKRRERRSLDEIYADMENIVYDAVYQAVLENLAATSRNEAGLASFILQTLRSGKFDA